jgi:hypothetical protein
MIFALGGHSGWIDLLLSSDPVFRSTVCVGDGKDPKLFIPRDVSKVVGEHAQVYPPITSGTKARYVGMEGDPEDVLVHFQPEPSAQAGLLFLIVIDSVSQLKARLGNYPDDHAP